LVLRNSINHFSRDLDIPGFSFSGTQLSSFSEAHIAGQTRTMDWVGGVNLWTEDFEQDSVVPNQALDFDSQTIGAFIQTTLPLNDNWMFEGGLRIDKTSDYGSFVLPRFSFLYTPSSDTTIRIGGGLGYKEPSPFTEDAEAIQFRGVLPLVSASLDAEESAGANIDINRSIDLGSDLSLNLNLLLFYTRVDDPLRLVETAANQFSYSQPNDYLDTRGAEINAVWRWQDFKVFLGYTHADVEEHATTGTFTSPLIPRDRVNTVFVYEREDDVRIGLEAYYYGRQELNNGTKSRDFWIFGLMMEKVFSEQYSLFLNFENFTDTRQTRFESINSGSLASPVFNDIFAPLDGFVVNGGVKLRF